MKTSNIVEIISVGDEVLRGFTVNTNGAYLAKYLFDRGYIIKYQTNIGDNEFDVTEAIKVASKRASHIFLIGGLGPTEDDLTKEILAKYLGRNLTEHRESLLNLEKYYKGRNRKLTNSSKKQIMVLENSTVLNNLVGIAPGEILEENGIKYYLLPGPPREFHFLVDEYFDKYLEKEVFYSEKINVHALGESPIEVRLRKLGIDGDITVNTYAKGAFTEIDAISYSKDKTKFETCMSLIKNEFKGFIFEENSLEEAVVKRLIDKGLKISFMESITGGRLASSITSVPGSSNVLKESYVTYSNEAKIKLGVDKNIIEKYSVVSKETARSMVEALEKITGADIVVSVTGEAGPIPSVKDVGTVYSSIKYRDEIEDLSFNFSGSRENIQSSSTTSILSRILLIIGG